MGLTKEQTRGCKMKDKDYLEFLCTMRKWRAVATSWHELTSEVNSRLQCVAKIMAMPGTRTTCAGLDWSHATKEGQVCSTQVYGEVTNARQVGMRMRSKCTGTHRHAHVDVSNTIEKRKPTGTLVRQVARAMEEQMREDQQELKTREKKKETKDAKRMRGIVHKSNKNKRTSHVQR